MAHLGGQFGANGGLTPQQAATVANAFPFPGGAHMLSLAGFGGLGQLGGAGGQLGGFVPRKMDLKVRPRAPDTPASAAAPGTALLLPTPAAIHSS